MGIKHYTGWHLTGLREMVARKAVFLDRDGVLNRSIVVDGKPYPPRTWDEFVLVDGVEEGCQRLSDAGYLLICVTNQPDIARGLQNVDLVDRINAALMQRLGLHEVRVCAHDDGDNCECRKPKPGMLTQAAAQWDIDLGISFMVGDRWRDIDAGRAAGCGTVHIDYGYNERRPTSPDFVCGSFEEAVDWMINTSS